MIDQYYTPEIFIFKMQYLVYKVFPFVFLCAIISSVLTNNGEIEMSVSVSKIDGKHYSLHIIGDDLYPFIELLARLWNDSDIGSNNIDHKKGVEVLKHILRDY